MSYKERKANTSHSSDLKETYDTESQEEHAQSLHKEGDNDNVIADDDDREIDDDEDDEGTDDEDNSDDEEIEENGDDAKGCVAAFDLPDDVFSVRMIL